MPPNGQLPSHVVIHSTPFPEFDNDKDDTSSGVSLSDLTERLKQFGCNNPKLPGSSSKIPQGCNR